MKLCERFPLLDLMCLLDKISRFLSAEEKTPYVNFCRVMLALRNRAPAAATNELFENEN